MKIALLSITQTVLVIPRNTGIIYTNQIGGTQCNHPELEGFIVPIEYDTPIKEPQESLTNKLCEMFPDGNPGVVEYKEAERIQELLNNSPFTKDVTIDWDKLFMSKEAWVHVIVTGTLDDTIEMAAVKEAVLTWPNSD